MQGKKAAFTWSVLHSVADTIEDDILTKHNEIEYLFGINLLTGIFIFIYSFFSPITISFYSLGVIFLYAIATIGGDYCYIKALKNLPVGLANLIDSGSVFLILICDIILGYIHPKGIFFLLFALYIVAIYVFSMETNKMKKDITCKQIDLKQIFILVTSTIFYAAVPYFLRWALKAGANASGVNFFYYMFAIPFFYFLYQKEKKKNKDISKKDKRYKICILVTALLFCFTSILNVLAYQSTAPVVVMLLQKLQLFFIVGISVLRKTDKMNWKKMVSLIVGVFCITVLSLLN